MPPLTHHDEAQLEIYLKQGWTSTMIYNEFLYKPFHPARGSRTAIKVRMKRFKAKFTVFPAKGGRPRVITPKIRDFIVESCLQQQQQRQQQEQLQRMTLRDTVEDLQVKMMDKFEKWISSSVIKRCMTYYGFTVQRVRDGSREL